MNRTMAALAASLALGAGASFAGGGTDNPEHARTLVAQAASDGMTEGEVRKVDKDAGKITLKHGEIKSLGMPPMTMVFRAKDPVLLDKVQPGAKVRFRAEQQGSTLLVTAIEQSVACSDGFQSTGSPQTAAIIEFQAQTATGKLKAVITPTGPSGCHCSYMRWSGHSECIDKA